MRRGYSLPGVMGACLLLFVLLLTFQRGLDRGRHRLSNHKYQQTAFWLATSGADLAEVRLSKGSLSVGTTLTSPQFKDGSFVVSSSRSGGAIVIVSKGVAGGQSHTLKRTVVLP